MKSTTKSIKSPAPATATALAPAPAPKITRAPRVKKNGTAPAGATTVPAVTTITARIDVGFGNALFLRGEGPGLTWNKGVALTCAAGDSWTITVPAASSPLVFKFLINDESWSRGEDYSAQPGSASEFSPSF